jgi:hypothetical protein
MLKAQQNKTVVNGFKGLSATANFQYFNLVHSFPIDYLHNVLLGVTKQMFSLWFNSKNHKKDYYLGNRTEDINAVLSAIKVPKQFSRPPKNIHDFSNWKGHEFRNFLLYYGYYVIKLFLKEKYHKHFSLLSFSIYILLKEEITKNQLELATNMIKKFTKQFQNIYGMEQMTHNVHILNHIPETVINNGPLWCYSMFSTESKNGVLTRIVNGKNNCLQELSLKLMLLEEFSLSPNIENYEKCHSKNISKPKSIRKLDCILERFFSESEIDKLLNIKYFIHKSQFYERENPKKKRHTDCFVKVSDGNIGKIIKIIRRDQQDLIILQIDYLADSSYFQYTNLTKCLSFLKMYEISEIEEKILLFENLFLYVTLPNKYEKDYIIFFLLQKCI